MAGDQATMAVPVLAQARRLVVKIGSALLVDRETGLREAWLDGLAQDVAEIRARGTDVIVASALDFPACGVMSSKGKAAEARSLVDLGAQQIDITHHRQPGEPRLDPAEAEAAALDYLAQVGATGTASVDGADITVTVTRTQPLHILPGQDRTITVTETASAVEEAAP